MEIAINHKSNQNSLPLGEVIAIVKDITKRIKIEEHKEDTIITLGTMMEDQEEDIMVVTKMVITTEIMKDIEGTQEVEGDIEADFKGENAMGVRVSMKRTKEISQGSKIGISKRETIHTSLRLQMNQQSNHNQTNKMVDQSEGTEGIGAKQTLRGLTIIEAITDSTITEITTIETIIITTTEIATTTDNTNQKTVTTTIIETITMATDKKMLDLLKIIQAATRVETRNLTTKLSRRNKLITRQTAFQKEGDAGHNQVSIFLDAKWPSLIGLSAISTANCWLYLTPA